MLPVISIAVGGFCVILSGIIAMKYNLNQLQTLALTVTFIFSYVVGLAIAIA